jgi:hypothetical protein
LRYIASNKDLIGIYGLNGAGATLHYITAGFLEKRATKSFDAARYLNSYDDLRQAFGTNLTAATTHFITDGSREMRDPNLFPSDRYIASNPDLLRVFRYNLEAGSQHYLIHGRNEGRQITFDPLAYIGKYPDLANLSPEQATFHYITAGFDEMRATS